MGTSEATSARPSSFSSRLAKAANGLDSSPGMSWAIVAGTAATLSSVTRPAAQFVKPTCSRATLTGRAAAPAMPRANIPTLFALVAFAAGLDWGA